ncbi:MAG: helix-hairpin-helix domain-containing protein, partial [Verrucomicrobiaceae bacterium]
MPLPRTDSKPDVLRGTVERVTYHTEETGYCVLKVLPDKKRDAVALIGRAPRVVAGERFEAEGRWERNNDFGPQFRADTLQLSPPNSAEGMVKYLGSGLIDGIGPKYAERMIEKFGPKVFDIIENESAKLEDVDGIGTKRRKEIRASWMKQKSVHAIMLFLHKNGIGTARAQRIFKAYGEEALEIVRKNPYRLAADIRGIGFKTADDIAMKMGIEAQAPERIRAGILHTLEEGAGNGHCCLPRAELVKHAEKILAAAAEMIEEQLQALITAEELSLVNDALVYLPYLRAAEKSIARTMKQLALTPASYPVIDVEKAIPWAEQHTGKRLADSQRECVLQALKSRVLIITGGPGVGKTTILNTMLTILQAKAV